MPEGTKFSLGTWDKSDVLGTTVRTIDDITRYDDVGALLLYSCLARSYSLGTELLAETEVVGEAISGETPYIFGYSGGEICPVSDSFSSNSFHNNTVIACVI